MIDVSQTVGGPQCWSPFTIVVQRLSSEEIVTFSGNNLVGNYGLESDENRRGIVW